MYRFLVGAFILAAAQSAAAIDLIEPVQGSVLIADYHATAEHLSYLEDNGEALERVDLEGELHSRIFAKPSDKSMDDVLKSYEQVLAGAGFEVVTNIRELDESTRALAGAIQGPGGNAVAKRPYTKDGRPIPSATAQRIADATSHYVAARRRDGAAEAIVVIAVGEQKKLYLVEALERAAQEAEAINVNLDALRRQIDETGRVPLYGLHFASGEATLLPESGEALATVVSFLKERPEASFFVVGHTDARGELQRNLTLSRQRADATVQALLAMVPDAAGRLHAHGVGPLVPLASNERTEGRQHNRRIELVIKYD